MKLVWRVGTQPTQTAQQFWAKGEKYTVRKTTSLCEEEYEPSSRRPHRQPPDDIAQALKRGGV